MDIQLGLLAKQARGAEDQPAGDAEGEGVPRRDAGYDPQYGARPLKRTIQNLVQNPLARQVLAGEVTDGSTVIVDAGKDGIAFRKK